MIGEDPRRTGPSPALAPFVAWLAYEDAQLPEAREMALLPFLYLVVNQAKDHTRWYEVGRV